MVIVTLCGCDENYVVGHGMGILLRVFRVQSPTPPKEFVTVMKVYNT